MNRSDEPDVNNFAPRSWLGAKLGVAGPGSIDRSFFHTFRSCDVLLLYVFTILGRKQRQKVDPH